MNIDLHETCGCGATFNYKGLPSKGSDLVAQFRKAHANCRPAEKGIREEFQRHLAEVEEETNEQAS